jgi:hypothetical protein
MALVVLLRREKMFTRWQKPTRLTPTTDSKGRVKICLM